jgi:riboflavin synthase alpha subunit
MHVMVIALDRGQRGTQIHARRSLVLSNQVTGHRSCLHVQTNSTILSRFESEEAPASLDIVCQIKPNGRNVGLFISATS